MEFNTENKTVKIYYEQPKLKKYGTMSEFTLTSSGSAGGGTDTIRDPSFNTNNRGFFSGANKITNSSNLFGITDDEADPVQRVNDGRRD